MAQESGRCLVVDKMSTIVHDSLRVLLVVFQGFSDNLPPLVPQNITVIQSEANYFMSDAYKRKCHKEAAVHFWLLYCRRRWNSTLNESHLVRKFNQRTETKLWIQVTTSVCRFLVIFQHTRTLCFYGSRMAEKVCDHLNPKQIGRQIVKRLPQPLPYFCLHPGTR